MKVLWRVKKRLYVTKKVVLALISSSSEVFASNRCRAVSHQR